MLLLVISGSYYYYCLLLLATIVHTYTTFKHSNKLSRRMMLSVCTVYTTVPPA
jgi:hypothetical protein